MQQRILFYFLTISCFLLLHSSCVSESLDPDPALVCNTVVTYDDQMAEIIDNSCAYVGCHDGGGDAPGDYTNFAVLSTNLNETFERRVVEEQNMPPEYAPEGSPKTLTADELNLMRCWIEDGYPEN